MSLKYEPALEPQRVQGLNLSGATDEGGDFRRESHDRRGLQNLHLTGVAFRTSCHRSPDDRSRLQSLNPQP